MSWMNRAMATGVILASAAICSVRADGPPPAATQPDKSHTGPARILFKLVQGADKPIPAALRCEQWIIDRTAGLGSPFAADASEWTELTAQNKETQASSGNTRFQVRIARDPASRTVVVSLAEPGGTGRPSSLQLLDRIGEQEVFRLTRNAGPGNLFAAIEVVSPQDRPVSNWGESVNDLRLAMRIEPTTWSPGGTVKFLCLVENTGKQQARMVGWGAQTNLAVLEIADSSGKLVPAKGGAKDQSRNVVFWGWSPPVPAGGRQDSTLTGELSEDYILSVAGSTGTAWDWRLPPGEYTVKAVLDTQFQPGRATSTPGAPARSQPVTITVWAATTQPDS